MFGSALARPVTHCLGESLSTWRNLLVARPAAAAYQRAYNGDGEQD